MRAGVPLCPAVHMVLTPKRLPGDEGCSHSMSHRSSGPGKAPVGTLVPYMAYKRIVTFWNRGDFCMMHMQVSFLAFFLMRGCPGGGGGLSQVSEHISPASSKSAPDMKGCCPQAHHSPQIIYTVPSELLYCLAVTQPLPLNLSAKCCFTLNCPSSASWGLQPVSFLIDIGVKITIARGTFALSTYLHYIMTPYYTHFALICRGIY